jgi:uncharacterized protein with ATP-grasp and redox domains
MALSAMHRVVREKNESKEIFKKILAIPSLRGNQWTITSAEIVEDVFKIITRETGRKDPFKVEKQRQNSKMMEIYPALEKKVADSEIPLLAAVKLAIVGNAIDAMISENSAIMIDEINTRLEGMSLDQNAFDSFVSILRPCRRLLYLGDNAGEIVTDKLLIQTIKSQIDLEVFYTVRSQPALNDATLNDAAAVGMNEIAHVIENGITGPLPGTIVSRCSGEFQSLLRKCDLIISKGGGNYETLSEATTLNKQVVYLLLSKCPVYQRHFGISIGQPIFVSVFQNNVSG